jgi:hypothetical protein
MPSSGCDQPRETELKAATWPPAANAGSRQASDRSHGTGEEAK